MMYKVELFKDECMKNTIKKVLREKVIYQKNSSFK